MHGLHSSSDPRERKRRGGRGRMKDGRTDLKRQNRESCKEQGLTRGLESQKTKKNWSQQQSLEAGDVVRLFSLKRRSAHYPSGVRHSHGGASASNCSYPRRHVWLESLGPTYTRRCAHVAQQPRVAKKKERKKSGCSRS